MTDQSLDIVPSHSKASACEQILQVRGAGCIIALTEAFIRWQHVPWLLERPVSDSYLGLSLRLLLRLLLGVLWLCIRHIQCPPAHPGTTDIISRPLPAANPTVLL